MANQKQTRKDNRGRVLPPNISQKSDLRYIWRKTINGKSFVIVDADLISLKKKVIKKEADIENGTCNDLENSTLNQWFNKWIQVYKGNIKPITKQNYENYYKWYIAKSNIGNMKLGKMKRVHILEFYNVLFEKSKLSVGTIRYVNSLIYNCLEDARTDKILSDNPCTGVISKFRKDESIKRKALTLDEQDQFINFISKSPIYNIYTPLFAFLLGTGCRLGETLGITWNEIDLDNDVIHINHTLSYKSIDGKHKYFITSPKTRTSIRDIPIIPDLKQQLIKQKEYLLTTNITNDYEINGYKNFVFVSKKGKPFTQEFVNRLIHMVVSLNNKQEQELSFKESRTPLLLPTFSAHLLRHTFCTRFCEVESNVKVIQQIMGHSRIDTTLDIYTHVTVEKSNQVMLGLNGKIKIC